MKRTLLPLVAAVVAGAGYSAATALLDVPTLTTYVLGAALAFIFVMIAAPLALATRRPATGGDGGATEGGRFSFTLTGEYRGVLEPLDLLDRSSTSAASSRSGDSPDIPF